MCILAGADEAMRRARSSVRAGGAAVEPRRCAEGRRALAGRLWLLLWVLGAPLTAAESATPRATIELRGGEVQDIDVNLGADRHPEIELAARLVAADRHAGKGLHVSIVGNTSLARSGEALLRHTPGGRVLWLEIMVERCAVPGLYPVTVEISRRPLQPEDETAPIRLEFQVRVLRSPVCWLGSGGVFFLALPLAGLAFYGWTAVAHSKFLSADQVADVLRPYRWKDGGGTEPIERATDAVRARVRTQLRFRDRARAWLLANPLLFGLPLRSYEETAQILPGRRLNELFLIVQPQGRGYLEKNPEAARGRLFVSAGAGPTVFGLPDKGRIGGLVPDRELDPHQVKSLGGVELRSGSDGHPDQASGWRILQGRRADRSRPGRRVR